MATRAATCCSRAVAVAAVLVIAGIAAGGAGGCATAGPATYVFVVRHAEKASATPMMGATTTAPAAPASAAPSDPPLRPAGEARARELVHVLAHAGIEAIFQTDTTRSRQTVAPLAEALGLRPIELPRTDTSGLARRVLAEHAGRAVLVAAHSDTIGAIVTALGGPPIAPITDGDYDNLLLVICDPRDRGGRVRVVHLQYGTPAP